MHDRDNDPGYFGIIYHDILFHAELSDKAKLLYVALTSLAKSKGYAWPTGAYLAELFGVSIDAINENLAKLQDHGFIFRETYNDGFKRKRKIWVAREKIKEFLQRGENAPIDEGENALSGKGENAPFSIYNKINEKDNPPLSPKGDGAGGMAYADPAAKPNPYAASTDARFRKVDPDEFDFLLNGPINKHLTEPEKMQLMRFPAEKVRQAIGWALERKNLGDLASAIHHAIRNGLEPKKAASMPISKKDIKAWIDYLNETMAQAGKKERYSIDNQEFNGYLADYEDVATEKGFLVKCVPCAISVRLLYDADVRRSIEDHMFMIIGRPNAR